MLVFRVAVLNLVKRTRTVVVIIALQISFARAVLLLVMILGTAVLKVGHVKVIHVHVLLLENPVQVMKNVARCIVMRVLNVLVVTLVDIVWLIQTVVVLFHASPMLTPS